MKSNDVGIEALMCVISKACCDCIKELLADDGDDRNFFHLSRCASLDDIERYKSVVNALIDARAARMKIRQSKLVARAFAEVDLDNAGLLSRCETKQQRSYWADDQADSIRHLWSYFHGLAKRAKRSHNNTVNILKVRYRAVLKSEQGMVASEDMDDEGADDESDDYDDHSHLSLEAESSEAEALADMPAIADSPQNSVAIRTLPALPAPEPRVNGETFEERMSRLKNSRESHVRKDLFQKFQGAAAAEKKLRDAFPLTEAEPVSEDESVQVIGTSRRHRTTMNQMCR